MLQDFGKKSGSCETVLLIDDYDYPFAHPCAQFDEGDFKTYHIEIEEILLHLHAFIKAEGIYYKKVFISASTYYKYCSMFTAPTIVDDISLDSFLKSLNKL